MYIDSIDTLILCGGKGTRLKSIVNDKPKILAEINGIPFIEYLLNYLDKEGVTRTILCTGNMHTKIEDWVNTKYNGKIQISLSNEKIPLGTAGAIKNAEKMINSNLFIVINGDSLIDLRLDKFINFHQKKNAIVSIATSSVGEREASGTVIIDSNDCIVDFIEKSDIKKTNQSFINAGIYIFTKNILSFMSIQKKLSIEYEFFPWILKKYNNRIGKNPYYYELKFPESIEIDNKEDLNLARKII